MRIVRQAALVVCALFSFDAFAFDPLHTADSKPATLTVRVKDVMHRFGTAANSKDLAAFHDSAVMSGAFAKQFPIEKMNAAFKPLLDSGVDLTQLDKMQPVLDGTPQVDPNNQLVVKGHFPSDPPTAFEMHFIREGAKLGLSFIDVHLLKQGPAQPDASSLRAMMSRSTNSTAGVQLPSEQMTAVRSAMHAFALAVNRKDMSEFLKADIVSQRWRDSQTAAQLDASYHNTIATRGDFTLLDPMLPVIPEAPQVDASGELDVIGYYAAADSRIGFKMGFIKEDGSWRLVNFSIAPKHSVAPPDS
jgi:hypothetical protein